MNRIILLYFLYTYYLLTIFLLFSYYSHTILLLFSYYFLTILLLFSYYFLTMLLLFTYYFLSIFLIFFYHPFITSFLLQFIVFSQFEVLLALLVDMSLVFDSYTVLSELFDPGARNTRFFLSMAPWCGVRATLMPFELVKPGVERMHHRTSVQPDERRHSRRRRRKSLFSRRVPGICGASS